MMSWSVVPWSSGAHRSLREDNVDLGFCRLPGWSLGESRLDPPVCGGMGSRAAVSGYTLPAHGKENHRTNPVSACGWGKGGNHIIVLSLVLCYNHSKFFEDFFKLSLPKQNLVRFEQFHAHFFPWFHCQMRLICQFVLLSVHGLQ